MEATQTAFKKPLVLEHEFDAPKETVFTAFSTAGALGAWWGPVECKNSVISLDFRTGGMFHYKMDMQGQVSYGRLVFGAIEPYDLLEFTIAFADAEGRVVKAPFAIELPLEIAYRLVFTEHNGKTRITLTGTPVNPTKEEEQGFISINADMQRGFGASFNKLVHYLAAGKH